MMRTPKHNRLDGFSLPFAMFIFVIIVILSSALVSAVYRNNETFNRIVLAEEIRSNVTSAINILLVHPDKINYSEPQIISLYGEHRDSVTLNKEQWGLFDLLTAQTSYRGIREIQSVIIGSYRYDSTNVALMVPDEGKSIAVTGNVNIKGVCMLPESGFSQPSIEGKNFTGNRFDSPKKKSPAKLPDLNPNYAGLDIEYAYSKYMESGCPVISFDELGKDSLSNSFKDTVKTLYSSGSISLGSIFLKGKIVVLSDKEIFISKDAQINDVICFAPSIHVEKGFSGKLQMFATDSIRIESECQLKFPSVVGIIHKDENENDKKAFLSVGEKCNIMGVVFLFCKDDLSGKQAVLQIGKESNVMGQVYSNRYTELKGNIQGALYTNKFILTTPSSIYENALMDASINMFDLSKDYVGADLIGEGTAGDIIRWLY
ncbi:MAG TPA: hypothetical protein PKW49_11265 [Paludibacteraceae bacterium]|nr:hypothetical protein [Paludibacteraceae bacterium]